MTAPAYPLPRRVIGPADTRPRGLGRLRPREGWTAFGLLAFMLVVLAWSLDAADYRGGDLYWLTWVVIAGATWGLLSSRIGLTRWEAHALGGLIGAAVILVLAAGEISDDPDVGARVHALGQAAMQWYRDVSGPTHLSQENVAWLMVTGTLSWAIAHFASYAVFAHRRPMVAIALPGVMLLVNMVIAASVGMPFLIAYTVAALLLLVRVNLVDQRETWIRRRIGEAADVGTTAARSGLIVVLAAVIAAMILASVGSSAPLAGLWQSFQGRAQDVALRVNDYLNLSPAVRFHGDPFESRQLITGEWDASGLDTLRVEYSDGEAHYLRGTSHDRLVNGNEWVQGGIDSQAIGANASLIEALAGDGTYDVEEMNVVTTRITMLRGLNVILSPGVPQAVSVPVRLELLGAGGPFAALRPSGELAGGATYEVTSLVSKIDSTGLTKSELRAAGSDYPPEIIARYANPAADLDAYELAPAGHLSVPELARQIVETNELKNPFDIADAFQFYLSDSENFSYSSNVRGKCRSGESAADCFLRIREGYCEFYATTMILMLRSEGIPARRAVGYLPPGADGVVTSSAAHAWVEVYFPGHGWVSFDPTGGNGAAPIEYPEGDPAAVAPTPPRPDLEGNDAIQQRRRSEDGPPGGTLNGRDIGTSILPIAAGILALSIAAFLLWRRRPTRQPDVVVVYNRLTRMASLLGFPPRPAQTVFEYTGALADVGPEARPELHAVANAKVEATYRPVPLERDRLRAVAEAYRKARLELTRLLFRRRKRPGGGGVTVRRRLG